MDKQMPANKSTEILGTELPTAAEVDLYTEEQMKQLAIYWSHRLRTWVGNNPPMIHEWFMSLSKPKFAQFTQYVIESVRENPMPDWRVQSNFLMKEVPQ